MSINQEYGIISKLYKSRKNILKQLGQTGYDVSNNTNFSINEVNIMYQNNQQDMLLEQKDKNTGKIYIKYSVDKALRPQNIRDIIEDLYNLEQILQPNTDDTLLIVTKDSANDTLTNLLIELYARDNIYINIISLDELQFCLLEHFLVPKHTKLNNEEKEEVKKKYNIVDESNFPKISRFDPVAKINCLRPNEVCKIERKSPTAIIANYYRICVNK